MKPTDREAQIAAYTILYGAVKQGELHANLVEFIRDNPSVLLAQPHGSPVILLVRLAELTKRGNQSIDQLAGIITPELLAKNTISSQYGRTTTVELLTQLGLAHVIDQDVYRKAMGIALRKEECTAKGVIDQLTA